MITKIRYPFAMNIHLLIEKIPLGIQLYRFADYDLSNSYLVLDRVHLTSILPLSNQTMAIIVKS